MNFVKKGVGIISLAVLMSFFPGRIYAENHPNREERIAKTTSQERLTENYEESFKKTLENLNEKIKKESQNTININSGRGYRPTINENKPFIPEEVKFSYSKSHSLGEEGEIHMKWYAGGELTSDRNLKNIRFGGEVGNFGFGASIDPINNRRIFNFRNKIGKNSVEIIAGNNNLMQGKAHLSVPNIAEVDVFYDFASHQANYAVSKNYKNTNLRIFQQFQEGLTTTSANISYTLPESLLLDKILFNYSRNDYKNRSDEVRTSVGFQDKIGILNLEGRIDRIPAGIFPVIRGSIKHSWN
ncbi:hypothetical protein FJZ20_01835 [Candidatus Pacearchaeota archaeon]|nr:hypothetical protein [Candidatus Pacearchaeota archaeon]